jgi:hypothetical protein
MRYIKPQVIVTCGASSTIQNMGAQKGAPIALDHVSGQFSATSPAYSADE